MHAFLTTGWSYGSQSLVTLVTKVHFMDFGVNGIEAVSSRPVAVCRPIDCTCIGRTTNVHRGNFVYIQNFNFPVIYIIFNTYIMMSYIVCSLLANGIVMQLFSGPLPILLISNYRPISVLSVFSRNP